MQCAVGLWLGIIVQADTAARRPSWLQPAGVRAAADHLPTRGSRQDETDLGTDAQLLRLLRPIDASRRNVRNELRESDLNHLAGNTRCLGRPGRRVAAANADDTQGGAVCLVELSAVRAV